MDGNHVTGGQEPRPEQVDRRSAIRKVAAAGAVVWTSPLIISGGALAQGSTCTPKCAPTVFPNLDIAVSGYCPSPGNKAARVDLRLPSGTGTCPCLTDDVSVPAETCIKVPTAWRKDGTGQEVDIMVGVLDPISGYDQAFYVAKTTGSLGQGAWVNLDDLLFSVTCQDASGDRISRVCAYTVGFYFNPAGSCGSPTDEFVQPRDNCKIVCNVTNPCA